MKAMTEEPRDGAPPRPFLRLVSAYFEIAARRSTIRTELVAGLSTFLSLAYIVVVNPAILARGGFDPSAAFFATALLAGLATLTMGLWARLPFALAPGMEMNAYVAFYLIGTLGASVPQALGAVFWSGVLFVLVSATGLRERVLHSIPDVMKRALSLSVGVFIALVAFKISGVLLFDGVRLVGIGHVASPEALALVAGLVLIVVLNRLRIPAAVLISIALVVAGLAISGTAAPSAPLEMHFARFFSAFFQLDLIGALKPAFVPAILVLFLIDFYGSVAKLIGLSIRSTIAPEGAVPRLRQALLIDSGATVAGSLLGTTNMTVYVESGVGIAAGARTGLGAVVVGLGLLACLAFAPLVGYIPVAATTGALIYVAVTLCPRLDEIRGMDWFELVVLLAMQAVVILTFAIDKAFLVGAVGYLMRSALLRQMPDPYLLGSSVLLGAGYFLQ
jgi:AGZA family xanthine/uracil permease-like MFS transporter